MVLLLRLLFVLAPAAALRTLPVAHHTCTRPRAHVHASVLAAPPAPPPTSTFFDDGRGDDEPDEYLRLIDECEMRTMLTDWSARGRIYRMSDDVWVQERHASGLDIVERMMQVDDSDLQGRRLSLGLFEEDKVWAVATAEVSVRAGLQVRSLAIHPAELHQTTSTAYQRMLTGMRCLAEAIDVQLDLESLQENQPLDHLRQKLCFGDFETCSLADADFED